DSDQCTPQKPIPLNDGCDTNLASWVQDIVQSILSPRPHRKPRPPSADKLPAACGFVLESTTAQR
ncbi:MAG: penicillin-insensitive murein endopeptidase, partial [Cyanobacteria bacterium HKST-UBA03]|nr:penicillin-insensitive murein endopeptidase [Cyanobacteria bacterium HKST-UBA03]